MSCQQASRFITNNNNNNNISNNCKQHLNIQNNLNNNDSNNAAKGNCISKGVCQQEDPYVFTESVPTTPPILFNTQKTRTRLNDLTSTNTVLGIGKLQQSQKLPLTEANGKITANTLKTQASLSTISSLSSSTSALSPTTKITYSTTNTTTTNKNGVTQSSLSTLTATANNCNSKKPTNVCIVRPQLQQQQQHFKNEEDLKPVSPPPLYTLPTPSLWQTPLLLETTTLPTITTTTTTTITSITNTTLPQIGNVARQQAISNPTPIMGCVTPTVIQAVGSTTSTINPSLTTTAMAKVAPIIVHTPPLAPPPSPLAKQCLPPSKFHNHTLAQHLQKVECLKKSKKSVQSEKIAACHEDYKSIQSTSTSVKVSSSITAASLNTMIEGSTVSKSLTHSEKEELNEIPVNVIFRMAVVPQQQQNEKSNPNVQYVRPATSTNKQQEIDKEQLSTTPIPPPPPPQPSSVSSFSTTTPPSQIKTTTHMNRKSSIPASKNITTNQFVQQQIHTSSMQQQQQCNATTKTTALNFDNSKPFNSQAELLVKKLAVEEVNSSTNTAITKSITTSTNIKTKNSTHNSNKTPKSNTLSSTDISSINFNYNLPSYSWQMGCSTTKGAVAIVKISQHNIDLDITHLATPTGLPYCLQQFWLDANKNGFHPQSKEISLNSSVNRSLEREERIALHKQQLRRQAIQLLSTRSLQKLPMQIAKRRLLCVDRLLRKYHCNEQNKKELPDNVKRCCIDGCGANTLEMASHCQQHIVYNSAQHIFLPCTAKFADNTQCRIPVFDIAHDLPLCIEHARKRDAYNRLLFEQRPRKISTNSIINNNLITSSLTISNKANKEETNFTKRGNTVKSQQQQQIHKHILQQLPSNKHTNGNKRPVLVTQQQQQQQAHKRKITNGGNAVVGGNPLGRPQKRVKKTLEKSVVTTTVTKENATLINSVANTITNQNQQIPRLTSTSLKRKCSSTSLESLASNSQQSTTSSSAYTSQQPHLYGVNSSHVVTTTATVTTTSITSLPPPALAPLSSSSCGGGVSGLVGHGLPQHLFSFGHDNKSHQHNYHHPNQHTQLLHPLNINDKHSFTSKTSAASTPTELKDFISQFALIAAQKTPQNSNDNSATCLSNCDVNLLNTNSNSNFTSSGMGSTSSLPTGDDFLTQDMLSICENSSASSADTGLGGLSDAELMLGCPEDDIPLGDTRLLEEHDLENVLNSLPEDAFKELFTTVHQDESDEIERAIELADKHLKTLQQTIGSELGDFLDFNDDMLMDNGGDLCNEATVTGNSILDTTALFIGGGGGDNIGSSAQVTATSTTSAQGGGVVTSVIGTEIRGGLVQT